MRFLALGAIAIAFGGCAVQRAVVASETREKMVGLTAPEVLACMGVPANKMAEGPVEVWSYSSGDGYRSSSAIGGAQTTYSGGIASTLGSASSVSRSRYCTVNVTMTAGRVSRVNYVGPTGGLLTSGEQCAYAVQNC